MHGWTDGWIEKGLVFVMIPKRVRLGSFGDPSHSHYKQLSNQ